MWHTIILAGRLGKDAEQRYTPDGKAVTSFSVAVDSGSGENKKTIWLRVSCWDKLAEVTAQLKKGAKVMIEGRLTADESGNPRTFSRQDGSTGASFEITASAFSFLDPKRDEEEVDY